MSSITHLRDANEVPDQDVVETLERALDLAKRGQLRSVAIVGERVGGMTHSAYTTPDNIVLLGMLDMLRYHVLNTAAWEESD